MGLALIETRNPVYYAKGDSENYIPFDVVTLEIHESKARVTNHPVEDGSNITDHVIIEPETLTLEVIFSNTPLPSEQVPQAFLKVVDKKKPYSILSPLSIPNGKTVERCEDDYVYNPRRAQMAFDALYELHRDRSAISLITDMRDYENMIIIGISQNVDVDHSDSVFATLTLQKIVTVSTKQVSAPKIPAAKKKQNKGQQPTKEATEAETTKNDSLAKQILGG